VRSVPGTVSKILWHFTGGPFWKEGENRQDRRLKPSASAFDALVQILTSREIRLGSYREVVNVHVPRLLYHRKARRWRPRNVQVTIQSAPVCCLADIPISHLSYHAARYGKFAIGFHRVAVTKHGFNPVIYTLNNSSVMRVIHDGLENLQTLDLEYLQTVPDEDASPEVRPYIEDEADVIKAGIATAQDSFMHLLAFVKTFGHHEFQTIYSEREWRSVRAYHFAYTDIAMIVLPKRGSARYFDRFISKARKELALPLSIPIVAWEDLVES
jgi:hypothetical protein